MYVCLLAVFFFFFFFCLDHMYVCLLAVFFLFFFCFFCFLFSLFMPQLGRRFEGTLLLGLSVRSSAFLVRKNLRKHVT